MRDLAKSRRLPKSNWAVTRGQRQAVVPASDLCSSCDARAPVRSLTSFGMTRQNRGDANRTLFALFDLVSQLSREAAFEIGAEFDFIDGFGDFFGGGGRLGQI